MNASTAINAYSNVGIESIIMGADPHMLISLLFQGAIFEISNAKNGIAHKDIPAKGKAISKAISIIGEGLNASLDKTVGGELALSLSALYDYMVSRLVEANMKNDPTILDEIARLLSELKGAWDSIRPQVLQSTAQQNGSIAKQTYARA